MKIYFHPKDAGNNLFLTLERKYHSRGTNGTLTINQKPVCHTIELPWKDNKPKTSCIPEGRYQVLRRISKNHGAHMQLLDVEGRELILIHPANIALKELQGCIAPVTTLTGPGAGTESRLAFTALQQLIYKTLDEGNEVWLALFSVKNLLLEIHQVRQNFYGGNWKKIANQTHRYMGNKESVNNLKQKK